MTPAPQSHDDGSERREWLEPLLTFVPAILVAMALNWALRQGAGWEFRRALATSIAVGIVVGLVLQRIVRRRRGS